jgi:hypothetical protein
VPLFFVPVSLYLLSATLVGCQECTQQGAAFITPAGSASLPPLPASPHCRYSAQAAGHQLLLSQFEEAMARLEACPLHPRLATPAWRRLADLQPPARVREWRDKCARSHDSFATKVR